MVGGAEIGCCWETVRARTRARASPRRCRRLAPWCRSAGVVVQPVAQRRSLEVGRVTWERACVCGVETRLCVSDVLGGPGTVAWKRACACLASGSARCWWLSAPSLSPRARARVHARGQIVDGGALDVTPRVGVRPRDAGPCRYGIGGLPLDCGMEVYLPENVGVLWYVDADTSVGQSLTSKSNIKYPVVYVLLVWRQAIPRIRPTR